MDFYHTRAARLLIVAGICLLGFCLWLFLYFQHATLTAYSNNWLEPYTSSPASSSRSGLVLYTGPITNIFFHSLVVYPWKAASDPINADLIRNNMVTVAQFKVILQELYNDQYILYDPRLLYSVDSGGRLHPADVYVPEGKKPLILSLDDLNYYTWMKNDGFADKLVLKDGTVKTEVVLPDGSVADTVDGDVVPIVDSFVAAHPDFSFNGVRGVIGVTGFEGILGYRTQLAGATGDYERQRAALVVAALKKEGWLFASHSYSHGPDFLNGSISTSSLAADIALWKAQVEPLVGSTNMFIGPFGQLFSPNDPRRTQLLNAGFNVLYGVGIDGYRKYFPTCLVMDRIDVDGYRLTHNESFLQTRLGI